MLLNALKETFAVQGLPFEGVERSGPSTVRDQRRLLDDPLLIVIKLFVCNAVSARWQSASVSPRASCRNRWKIRQAAQHVHCCLMNADIENAFEAVTHRAPRHRQAVAGCLALMRDSHLIFAPSYNAYRRFRAGNHAPTQPTGATTDHRCRIPPVVATLPTEHRVAGADSNPYLAVAALLAGIAIGIEGNSNRPIPLGQRWVEDEATRLPPTGVIHRFSLSDAIGDTLSCIEVAYSEPRGRSCWN